MAAMAWPRARPNVLHPRQYGGINLERAYCDENYQLGTDLCGDIFRKFLIVYLVTFLHGLLS
jgi:hypothetical protein